MNHGAGYFVTAALASTAIVMSGGILSPLLFAGIAGIAAIGAKTTQ